MIVGSSGTKESDVQIVRIKIDMYQKSFKCFGPLFLYHLVWPMKDIFGFNIEVNSTLKWTYTNSKMEKVS